MYRNIYVLKKGDALSSLTLAGMGSVTSNPVPLGKFFDMLGMSENVLTLRDEASQNAKTSMEWEPMGNGAIYAIDHRTMYRYEISRLKTISEFAKASLT